MAKKNKANQAATPLEPSSRKTSKKIDIFAYDNYRAYLRDYYENEKSKNPDAFSYRSFSKRAGFSSSSLLHGVMHGDRALSLQHCFQILDAIRLRGRPRDYFVNLVLFNQASSKEERIKYFEIIKEYKEYLCARLLTKDQAAYYLEWYIPVVREMTNWSDFKADPKWIANRTCPTITPPDAQKALDVLQKLELIREEKGKWRPSYPIIETEAGDLGIRAAAFHSVLMDIGKQHLGQAPEKRDFSSISFSTSPAAFEIIRQKIHNFQKEIYEIIKNKADRCLLEKYGLPESLLDKKGATDVSLVGILNCQLLQVAQR